MIQETSILEKVLKAGGAITQYGLVKYGSDDDSCVMAAANSDDIIGVAQQAGVSGDMIRIMLLGVSRVKTGGVIARGAFVTSDASGLGVAIGVVAGTNYTAVGRALATSASGDIIPVLIDRSRPQG